MENIERIQKGLREQEYTGNPSKSAEDISILAGEYSYLYEQVDHILQLKPEIWNKMRNDFKSDTACERAWQGTDMGMAETRIRHTLKRVEKMMSALKTMITVAENEIRNRL